MKNYAFAKATDHGTAPDNRTAPPHLSAPMFRHPHILASDPDSRHA